MEKIRLYSKFVEPVRSHPTRFSSHTPYDATRHLTIRSARSLLVGENVPGSAIGGNPP